MKLYEKASILRSKNSGPFEITFDVLFDQQETYEAVKQSGRLTAEIVAKAYNVPVTSIHHVVFFDQAYGIKITMARAISSGSPGDRDVYGAQQHAPLMYIDV